MGLSRVFVALNSKTNAALVSVFSNLLLIVLKLAVGIAIGSVSVISEAAHSGLDLLAALIAFWAIRMAARPADSDHPYGHGKIENLGSSVEAILIVVAAVGITYEAVRRLIEGARPVSVDLGVGVMAVSIVVNLFVSRYLLRVARRTESIALEGDARHLTADVLTSVGVLIGLIVVGITKNYILDPLVALAVAALIVHTGWKMLRKSMGDLVDGKLPDEEEALIRQIFDDHRKQLVEFHSLRTRRSGGQRHIDLHMVVNRDATVQAAHALCDDLEGHIQARFPDASVTLHVEPCEGPCQSCETLCPEHQGKQPGDIPLA
ncbi:MAG: cation transporter [Chloroflexota bacterium]|nr:MAG: cation transporter [Chloroflexota bacterium]